jgi:hypothetical protein
METQVDLTAARKRLGETDDAPLDIRPDFDPIAQIRNHEDIVINYDDSKQPRLRIDPVDVDLMEAAAAVVYRSAPPVPASRTHWDGPNEERRQAVAERAVACFTAMQWQAANPPRRLRRMADWRPLAWLMPAMWPRRRRALGLTVQRLPFAARRERLAKWRPLVGLALRIWVRRGRPGAKSQVYIDPSYSVAP